MSRYLQKIGCLFLVALIAMGPVSSEEFNGTTYNLSSSEVKVSQPVNSAGINLTLQQKAGNFTLMDSEGNRVGINSSYKFWAGDHDYALTFERNVSGTLAYTLPHQGQLFILILRNSDPVRIILPPGYTTGDRILGVARPSPDYIQTDDNGDILTWYNTTEYNLIEVNYYKKNALDTMKKIFLILLVVAAGLLLEYYASIRRLRAIRDDVESKD